MHTLRFAPADLSLPVLLPWERRVLGLTALGLVTEGSKRQAGGEALVAQLLQNPQSLF